MHYSVSASQSPHMRTRATHGGAPSSLSPCRGQPLTMGYGGQSVRTTTGGVLRTVSRSPGPAGSSVANGVDPRHRPVSNERSCSPNYGREALQMPRVRQQASTSTTTPSVASVRGGSPMALGQRTSSPQPVAVAAAPQATTVTPISTTPMQVDVSGGGLQRRSGPAPFSVGQTSGQGLGFQRQGATPAPIPMHPGRGGTASAHVDRSSSRDKREKELPRPAPTVTTGPRVVSSGISPASSSSNFVRVRSISPNQGNGAGPPAVRHQAHIYTSANGAWQPSQAGTRQQGVGRVGDTLGSVQSVGRLGGVVSPQVSPQLGFRHVRESSAISTSPSATSGLTTVHPVSTGLRWGVEQQQQQQTADRGVAQQRTGSPMPPLSPHSRAVPQPQSPAPSASSNRYVTATSCAGATAANVLTQSPARLPRTASPQAQTSARGAHLRGPTSGTGPSPATSSSQQSTRSPQVTQSSTIHSPQVRSTSLQSRQQQQQQQQQQQKQQQQQAPQQWRVNDKISSMHEAYGVGSNSAWYDAQDMDFGSVPAASSTASMPAAVTNSDGEVVSADAHKLQPGMRVQIEDCICNVGDVVGYGSFGAVYSAEAIDPQRPPMVIKEILCYSLPDLKNAMFEGQLLNMFRRTKDFDARCVEDSAVARCRGFSGLPDACTRRVPSLVGMEIKQLSAGQCPEWRVRLAMTRIPGQPLDTYMESKKQEQEQWFKDAMRWGRPRDSKSLRKALIEAIDTTRELLLQLAPAIFEISKVALHRDANAHNILIAEGPGSERSTPCFGLVDFGLAVDEYCWQLEDPNSPEFDKSELRTRVGQDNAKTWHHLDVGGDCRYWPVSAWVQFLHGYAELDDCPSLRGEYQVLLDVHSLGITAVQLFAEMLPEPTNEETTMWPRSLSDVRNAWRDYWDTVSPLHRDLMDTFHNAGDWDHLKRKCIEHQAKARIQAELREIKWALGKVAQACEVEVFGGGPIRGARELCDALQLMIGCGEGNEQFVSRGSMSEPQQGPPQWLQLLETLDHQAVHQHQGSTSTPSTASSPGRTTSPGSQPKPYGARSLEADSARPSSLGPGKRLLASSMPLHSTAPRPVAAQHAAWALDGVGGCGSNGYYGSNGHGGGR